MPDCHCTCLQYVHKHCLCEKCNGKAVCKHTESHHWKKANAEARATQALIWQQESSHYMPSTELQSCSVNESSAGGVESGGTSTSSNDCTEQQASDACTSTSDASAELAENENALLDLGPSILVFCSTARSHTEEAFGVEMRMHKKILIPFGLNQYQEQ